MSRKPFITALCGLSVAAFLSGSVIAQQAPGTATTTTTTGPGTASSTTTTTSAPAPAPAPQPAPGTTSTTTTSTTTSTTKVPVAVKKAPAPKPVAKPATRTGTKVEETTTTSTTTTTAPPPQPVVVVKEEKPRTVYDEDTLEKMEDKLCVEGFKAYVGSEGKNVCNSIASAPDLAYTCAWDKDGPPAFPASKTGPCTLDFTEHRGEIVITRDKWKDDPPMKYGAKAQCCFRAAK